MPPIDELSRGEIGGKGGGGGGGEQVTAGLSAAELSVKYGVMVGDGGRTTHSEFSLKGEGRGGRYADGRGAVLRVASVLDEKR